MLTLKELESLAIRDKDGTRTVSAGANVCLYIEPPFEEISDNLLDVYDAYLQICPKEELVWYLTHSMEKHEKVKKGTLNIPRTWLKSAKKSKKLMAFEIKDAISEYYADTANWKFQFVSRSRENKFFQKRANIVEILFPCRFVENNLKEFLEFAKYACTELPFLSGHAGYTLEVSRYYENKGAYDNALSLSMRYKELDISEPEFSQVVKKHQGIKGVNWLTILGDSFSKHINAEEKKVDKDVSYSNISGGLIITAGNKPAVGDGNRGEFVSAYFEVYKSVKNLIVDPPFPLRVSGSFEDRMEKSHQWVHRFEKK